MCYDADDTPSIEMLCNCCGGAGHKMLVCPSPKKHRSHMYLVALHTNAAKRKDDNALTKYGANVGGRRPPPRGQKAPFKAMPRRYSATMPFRRFEPGTPRPTQGQLQAARELLERELLETEDADVERADAVTETELAVTDAARVTTQQPVPARGKTSASRTKLSESQVPDADTLENTTVISRLNHGRIPSMVTVKDEGSRQKMVLDCMHANLRRKTRSCPVRSGEPSILDWRARVRSRSVISPSLVEPMIELSMTSRANSGE
jgi:hypothetical protein